MGDYLSIAGAAFDIIAGGAKNCFVGGTDVLTGSLDEGAATFSDKNIEDIQVGDKVWSRDQNNAAAPLELKAVTNVFQHQAYDLQKVSLTDSDGNADEIESTDEHPYQGAHEYAPVGQAALRACRETSRADRWNYALSSGIRYAGGTPAPPMHGVDGVPVLALSVCGVAAELAGPGGF